MDGLLAGKAGGFDEVQPFFDAAGFGAVAVVIEDALAPGEAEGGIFGAREDCGVFNGDAALVVVAVERPGLELAAGEFAFVHQEMEGMFVVVALFADGVEAGDEVGFGEGRELELWWWVHQNPAPLATRPILRTWGAAVLSQYTIAPMRLKRSQFELHAIVGDFEAGIDDLAMFGTAFVEDGIGVVDVEQDAAAAGVAREEFKQSVFAGEREMSHLARFLFAAAGLDEFVVAPEGAVEESDAAGCCGFGPLLI